MRKLLFLLITLILVATVVHLMLDPLIRQMLYPAPPIQVPTPPSPIEEVVLELPGGERAVAWAQQHPDATSPAVAFFHGNGENLETVRLSGMFEQLTALGAHVLAVDYPGYGRSTGEPSEASLTATGEAALQWLGERHPQSQRVLLGWSLGAAVAAQTAARQSDEIDALILMSAWADLPSLAAMHYPSWMVSMGLKDRYDSVVAASKIQAPVLMIHGTLDELIPLTQGQQLHQAFVASTDEGTASEPPKLVEVPGAGHNDLLGQPVVWQELAAFLRPLKPAAETAL